MRVAEGAPVRARLLLACFLLAGTARADEPPLLSLALRFAGGVAMDAGPQTAWRVAPFSVGVGAEGAFRTEPWASIYGLAIVEGTTFHAGGAAGVRFRPGDDGALRFGLGVSALLAPSTLFGLQASTGGCGKPGAVRLCAELEATAYVAGDLLPANQVSTQLRVALELGFDVF
jgi:hypothetical protein